MPEKVLVNRRLIEAEPRNPLRRFLDKQAKGENPGPSLAIKAVCWTCRGGGADDYNELVRDRVQDCDMQSCPLWQFRPYRKK